MRVITIARNYKGDDEVHLAGCAHLKQRARYQPHGWGNFRGETLAAAIREADTEMAGAFGEKVYDDPANHGSQPWTVEIMHHAPCFRDALKRAGITFSDRGEPQGGTR